jgi:GNAT superfamily N-acetyltransferase
MDIEIRSLSEEDIPRAMELKNALGWNQTPEDWRRFLQLAPEGCFKAVREGELVATAIACVFDRVCWIGMVIVQEEYRHQGVGRRIMIRCMQYSAERDCDLIVLDATRDGVSMYGRLGFRPEFLVGTVRGMISEHTPAQLNAPEDLELRRIRYGDLEAVVTLEAEALGAVREALLVHLVKEFPGRGFVCPGPQGGVRGFVLYRRGFHSVQVGPMCARDDETAHTLLHAAFSDLISAGGRAPVVLTVPINNSGILKLIRSCGLSVDPRLTRMTRGRKRLHAREDMVYALSGPEKG